MPEKIRIVNADAFEFAEKNMNGDAYDMVFVDIWHDPSDGCDLYLRMKEFEPRLPQAKFVYWIEDTLKLYI
jgi:predicted membrane-bound spermidine synthase